jgi:hypothetical protein
MRCLSRCAVFLLLTHAAAQEPKGYVGAQEKLPFDPGPQPIAFSHKQHAAASLKCLDCHSGAASAEQAGLPSTAKCMACHRAVRPESAEVKKLAAYHQRAEKVPWLRVYRVRDFVFFSHASHAKAGASCSECHGPVETRDVLLKEVSTNMAACMSCHRAKKASTDCSLCHQLGQ